MLGLIHAIWCANPRLYRLPADYEPLGLDGPMPYNKSFHIGQVRVLFASSSLCNRVDLMFRCTSNAEALFSNVWSGHCYMQEETTTGPLLPLQTKEHHRTVM